MLGGHELLLIIRAQNQASAAIGRFSRDIRALETRRVVQARKTALQTRAIQQAQRAYQMQSRFGSQNLALQQRELAVRNQISSVAQRDANLSLRRAGIVSRGNQLLGQEQKYQYAIQNLTGQQTALDTRRLRIQQGIARTQASIASFETGGLARQKATLTVYNAETTVMRKQLALAKAQIAQARVLESEEASVASKMLAQQRLTIAQRDVRSSRRNVAIQKQSLSELRLQIQDLNRTLAIQSSQLLEVAGSEDALIRQQKTLQGQIARLQDAWIMLGEREKAIQGVEAAHEKQLAELQLRLKGVIASQAEMGAQAAIVGRQLAATNVEIAETNRLLAVQGDERWAAISRGITHASRVMQLFGLVSTAAMGYAAKTAADFNTEVTKAATQARKPGDTIQSTMRISNRLMDVVLKQMLEFPATSQEMGNSLYEIFSGTNVQGINKAAGMLRVFNMMAVAGQTDLETMTDAGISLYNNFRNEFPKMTDAANAFFAAVRFGRMDANQFAGSLSNILPIAKEAGLRFSDVADAMALLTRQSGARFTSRDATGLARLIQIFARPEMLKGLRSIGVTVEDLRTGKMQPLLTTIEQIKKQMEFRHIRPGPETLNFFKDISRLGGGAGSRGFTGTIQAQRSFAFLVNNVKEYQRVSKQVNDDNDEFIKSFQALRKTPGVEWKVFINQLKAAVIVLGQGAIPAFIAMGQWVANLVHWFNQLSPETRRLIGYFAAIGSVAVLVIGVLGSVVGSIMSMVFAFKLLRAAKAAAALEQSAAATTGLASAAGFATPEIAILVAAIGGLLILYTMYPKQAHEVIRYTKMITNELIKLDKRLISLVSHPWRILVHVGVKVPPNVGGFFKRYLGTPLRDAAHLLPGVGVSMDTYNLIKSLRGKQPDFTGKPLKINFNAVDQLVRPIKNARKQMQKETSEALVQASASGVKATKTFVQLYRALLNARRELNRHPESIKAQMKYQVALDNLRQNVTTQQYKAATAASTAAARHQAKYSDAEIQREYAKVRQLEKIAKNTKTYSAWKAYYAALDKLQSRASSAQMQALDALSTASDKTTKKVASNAKKQAATAQKMFSQVLSNAENMYQTFYQQNQNAFGQIFQGPFMQSAAIQDRLQYGNASAGLTPADLLKDLRSQVTQFHTFRRQTDRLTTRGLPTGLVNQIKALGPDQAMEQIKLLNKMTPAQLKEYGRLWRQGQKDIHTATMKDLNNQLDSWRKHGKRIALAIAAGLRDENTSLESALRSMILKAFPGLGKNKTNRPARTTPSRNRSTGTSGPKEHHEHTHYHVPPSRGTNPTIKKQLSDANWRHRTRQR